MNHNSNYNNPINERLRGAFQAYVLTFMGTTGTFPRLIDNFVPVLETLSGNYPLPAKIATGTLYLGTVVLSPVLFFGILDGVVDVVRGTNHATVDYFIDVLSRHKKNQPPHDSLEQKLKE